MRRTTFAEKLAARVREGSPGECWPCRDGTGRLFISYYVDGRRTSMSASRMAWIVAFGPISDGLYVLHDCDNPPCCNPAHLHLGTHADNMREAADRGLLVLPATRRPANEPDVHAVRTRYAAGESQQRIADSLGVSQSTVSRIIRRVEHYA